MKISLIVVGKTDASYIEDGILVYENRLKHYIVYERIVIPDLRNTKKLSPEMQNKKEGDLILAKLEKSDVVILLDERGKMLSSKELASYLQKHMISGIKRLVFVIGGPYGFSQDLKKRANGLLSLSKMTFSHQMVRMIFVEQLYRGFTILKGEPYHHDS